jgi:hypothetical protein
MKKPRPTYLKVSISLDLEQETDQRLLEFFDALPAGMKANALRRLLAQSLPKSDAQLQELLGQVAMDARLRNQCAGRPRQAERASAPMRFSPSFVAAQVQLTQSGDGARPATGDGVLANEQYGHASAVDAVVAEAVVGPDGQCSEPTADEGYERGQGSQPGSAASGAPARRRLNVGGLIPSFTS